MKNTYTRTLFNPDLTKAKVELLIHEGLKYTKQESEPKQINYTGLTSWDIIEGGEEAKEIEESGLIDDYHEYLVLHFNNGETATFRNSYVTLFII